LAAARPSPSMHEQLLLVEDDDAIASALRMHLEEAGYRLHREADGKQAMSTIAQQRFDLVLLDVMLPGADGWEVCRHLRAHHADVPVIMLSARSTEAHRVLGLELGADDYLAKPFSMLELVARVRALLRRVCQLRASASVLLAAPEHVVQCGPFLLNTARRELTRSSAEGAPSPVPLTLREFDLLHFLLRHPGRAFGRNELLQRVWGAGFDGYEHTVNSHINRLRTKIEDDPREPRRIVTVWGVGYRFEGTSV
jgi:DNA-binding response OmpR family regulator